MKEFLINFVFLLGCALIMGGAWLAYWPLGIVACGAFLIFLAVAVVRIDEHHKRSAGE